MYYLRICAYRPAAPGAKKPSDMDVQTDQTEGNVEKEDKEAGQNN